MLFRSTLIVWHSLASECRSNSKARRESFNPFIYYFILFFRFLDVAS